MIRLDGPSVRTLHVNLDEALREESDQTDDLIRISGKSCPEFPEPTIIRIHDLRHAGATILMTLGVPDPIVRKLTGHRSRELERYQHLTPELRAMTVNLIATELFGSKQSRKESGTPTGTVRKTRTVANRARREVLKRGVWDEFRNWLTSPVSDALDAAKTLKYELVLRFLTENGANSSAK